jgi:hypothetical protein
MSDSFRREDIINRIVERGKFLFWGGKNLLLTLISSPRKKILRGEH